MIYLSDVWQSASYNINKSITMAPGLIFATALGLPFLLVVYLSTYIHTIYK